MKLLEEARCVGLQLVIISINLLIIFSINQSLDWSIEMSGIVDQSFPKPLMTSTNILFCPQCKDIHYPVIDELSKPKIFTYTVLFLKIIKKINCNQFKELTTNLSVIVALFRDYWFHRENHGVSPIRPENVQFPTHHIKTKQNKGGVRLGVLRR